MIDIEGYMAELTARLKERFDGRLVYVGLQGSYRRGEANEKSDVDVMAVLDELNVEDLDAYKALIASLNVGAPSCGFICGAKELANWNALEVCQLVHETLDYYGTLKGLVPSYTDEDVRSYVKSSAAAGYHMLCHEYVYADAQACGQNLRGCYKALFPLLQNLHYLRSGHYAATKKELLGLLGGEDRELLLRAMELKQGGACRVPEDFRRIFLWCRNLLQTL